MGGSINEHSGGKQSGSKNRFKSPENNSVAFRADHTGDTLHAGADISALRQGNIPGTTWEQKRVLPRRKVIYDFAEEAQPFTG